MVQYFIDLERDQPVDLRDAGIEHRVGVAGHGDRAREHLRDELLDHVAPALACGCLDAESPLVDDLLEQADWADLGTWLL